MPFYIILLHRENPLLYSSPLEGGGGSPLPILPLPLGGGGYRWGREIITIKQLAN